MAMPTERFTFTGHSGDELAARLDLPEGPVLATALFALLVVDELQADWAEAVLNLAINAVWISALLHGMTAAPLARWFGRRTG